MGLYAKWGWCWLGKHFRISHKFYFPPHSPAHPTQQTQRASMFFSRQRKGEKHTIHRKHENPPLSKSGNNTVLSVRQTQKPLRCTLLFRWFSEKASVWVDDILWFMPWGHNIIEQWPESFHRTKRAAGKPLKGKMLSLIAGNMNGARPN